MAETLVLVTILALPVVSGCLVLLFVRWNRGRSRRLGWRRTLCGNAVVFLFLSSAVLAAGEVYYRFAFDATDSFGLSRTTKRWFERHYHKNNVRVRDSIDYGRKIPRQRRRVTFIGDSFTAGHGIEDVEDRFANLVRRMRKNLQVHVLARNGFETGDTLGMIERMRKTGYEFDVLVLVYCLNDLTDLTPEAQEFHDRLYRSEGPGFLCEHSYLLNTIYYRLLATREPAVLNYYDFLASAYEADAEIWARQRRRLEQLKEKADEVGSTLLVVTFPFLHTVSSDAYEFEDAHRALDAFWKGLDTPHLDLLPLYRDSDPEDLVISPRDAHPSRKAHAMAAEAIAEFLDGNLGEPPDRKRGS